MHRAGIHEKLAYKERPPQQHANSTRSVQEMRQQQSSINRNNWPWQWFRAGDNCLWGH